MCLRASHWWTNYTEIVIYKSLIIIMSSCAPPVIFPYYSVRMRLQVRKYYVHIASTMAARCGGCDAGRLCSSGGASALRPCSTWGRASPLALFNVNAPLTTLHSIFITFFNISEVSYAVIDYRVNLLRFAMPQFVIIRFIANWGTGEKIMR